MKFYLEITLLPNADIGSAFLWSKIFQQIHLGFVEVKNDDNSIPMGISFPEYNVNEKKITVGRKLRIFAEDEATLARFNIAKWLSRFSDYVHYTRIRPVPDKLLGYAIYRRWQPKVNKERLARRFARRHDLDYVSALLRYDSMTHRAIKTPFIRMRSLSREQDFCLWVNKTSTSDLSGGQFNCYGLSNTSSVPEFF